MNGRADEIADDLWRQVRALTARVEELEKRAGQDDVGPDEQATLDRLRIRAARAIRRAELANGLADQLADLPRSTTA